MAELSGAVILVTGGAMGLGEAIARRATSAGASVALLDRNLTAAVRVARDLPGARAYQADVTAVEEMERVCAQIVADFGKLDGAVNNAGIGGEPGAVLECTPKNWGHVIEVNLTGVFNSVRAELPHLLATGGGSIVNVASMAGVLSDYNHPAYTASKHGVGRARLWHQRHSLQCPVPQLRQDADDSGGHQRSQSLGRYRPNAPHRPAGYC